MTVPVSRCGLAQRSRLAVLAGSCVFALLVSLLTATPAPAFTDCAVPPQIMPSSQLASGMTGSGSTTIRGSSPTTFDIEVLGVMNDYIWLGIDAIVIRITGPQSFLDEVGGVFFGMSGSPVYVNGMFIGSVSYGVSWDPTIVGLTPAQAMIDLFGLQGSSGPSALPVRIPFDEGTRRSIAAATGRAPNEVVGGLQLLPSYLGVSGLSAPRLDQLQDMLDESGAGVTVVPASSLSANLPVDPRRFTAGQPIGSVLSWGDLTISAAGTVAVACGDELVAFGHSLFWNPPGDLAIGMTGVDVLAVGSGQGLWAGDMVPVLTEPRGTFLQDRFAGQAGFVGIEPRSAPITSAVTSLDTGRTREGLTESIYPDDGWLQHTVWGHHILNFGAVQQALGPGTSEISYTIQGTREDGSPFSVNNRGMFASQWDATESVWKLISALDQLVFNPFEDIAITGVDTTGAITSEDLTSRIAMVRTASSIQPKLRSRDVLKVRPGERITVEVTLSESTGTATVTTFTMRVPRHAGNSTVKLRGGHDRLYYEAYSFDELLYQLSSGEHENDLIVSAFGRQHVERQTVLVAGRASFRIQVVG